MQTGEIVLVPFPFAELTDVKVRPAVVVCTTSDSYKDVVLAAISSVVKSPIPSNEFVVRVSSGNRLRKDSVVKTDRLFTTKRESVIAVLGRLDPDDRETFITRFRSLVS